MTTLLDRLSTTRGIFRTTVLIKRVNVLTLLVSAYVVLLPFQIPINNNINAAPADAFLLLILVLAPGLLKYRKSVWTIWHFALLMTFAVSTFVTALDVGDLSNYVWLNKDVGLLLLILSYAAITSVVADWGQVRYILRLFTISVVIQNQVAVGAFLMAYFYGVNVEPLFTSYGGQRLSGVLFDANAYGGLLALAFMICEGASWGRSPLFRGGLLLYCRLSLGMGLLLTFSRSAWISLFVSIVLLCAFRPNKGIKFALAGMTAAPCLLLLMGHRFMLIVESMAGRPEQGVSRFQLIRDAWAQFVHHPLWGGGLGSFAAHEETVVHNTALWFLADFGILGFAVLLTFLGWFFVAGWSAYRYAPRNQKPVALALLLGHTAMFTLAMGIEGFYQRHWWVVFALIASSSAIARRRVCKRPNERFAESKVLHDLPEQHQY